MRTTEHRRVGRATYNTPVRLIVAEGAVDGRSEDISAGGVLVLSRASCAPGQRVSLRFALPMEGTVVTIDADVRWVRPASGVDRQGLNAIGVEFREVPGPVRDSIARYVALMGDPHGT